MGNFAIVIGVWLAGHALRNFGHPVLRKLGALIYLGATFLAGYFISGRSWVGGTVAVAGWFLLPWLDIVLRVRGMRLPMNKELNYRPPPGREEFPPLPEVTDAFEAAGFERVDDVGWDGGEVRQFVRLFYLPERRMQGAISFHQQHGAGLGFLSCTTRTADGRTFITTDNPYSNLPQPPDVVVQSLRQVSTIAELIEEHEAMLAACGVDAATEGEELDPETLPERLSRELSRQIRHNLLTGYITDAGEGKFRYSWRGCFYLWGRVVRDMVRLA
jgi:hypothetical protein